MKIQINIYEYNGEFYSPLKGCLYVNFFTDNGYSVEDAKNVLGHMALNHSTLANMFKLQGVKSGKVCIEYEFTDDDEYIDGDEMYLIYDSETGKLDEDES